MALSISLTSPHGETCSTGYLKLSEVEVHRHADWGSVTFIVWRDSTSRTADKDHIGLIRVLIGSGTNYAIETDILGKTTAQLYTFFKTKTVSFMGQSLDLSEASDC